MKHKRIVTVTAALILVTAVLGALCIHGQNQKYSIVTIDPHTYYTVVSVIDGDTFDADINGTVITVRVLGINTPETVDPRKPVECYGKEASNEAKELLTGRKVRLESNPGREPLDKYHRYLLYIYRDDGLFYNEFMIEHGFAYEYTFNHESYTYQTEFKKVEAEAQKNQVGLWKACS